MGAYIGTLVTLDTIVNYPLRYVNCDTAFLESCCSGRQCSVFDAFEDGDRKVVPLLGIDNIDCPADKFRTIRIFYFSLNC